MRNRITAAAVALLGVVVWWLSTRFPTLDDGHPGPALFPQLIAIGLAASAIGLLFIHRGGTNGATSDTDGGGWWRLLMGLVLVALFPLMRTYLGFIAALSILGLSIAIVLRSRLVVAVPVVFISVVLIYWLFTGLLGVPL